MDGREVEFLIVGSGAGGATLARELARRQREVLVLERGNYETQIGTLRASLRYYDNSKVTKNPITSQEGTILWRAFMAGGSTVVALANITPCLQEELAERVVNGSAGGGMVKAVANGRQQIIAITIEKEVVDPDDLEMLQDLVMAAVNDALSKSQEMVSSEMGKFLPPGMSIPGLM